MIHLLNRFANYNPRLFCLICGLLMGLTFAPIFAFPLILCISGLVYCISIAKTKREALILGWIFGFGCFLAGLYWISIATLVYRKYWYIFPFSLLGIPAILAIYIAASAFLAFYFRKTRFYLVAFCILWIISEFLRSILFTGFPWNLLAHTSAFSVELMQVVYLIGEFGLSFIIAYIGCLGYFILSDAHIINKRLHITCSIILILFSCLYGVYRTNANPTQFSNIPVRIVQPSIPQEDKFDPEQEIDHLLSHVRLSINDADDHKDTIVVWPENAIMVPYEYINRLFSTTDVMQNLTILSGGFSFHDDDIHAALFGLSGSGDKIFEYHKSHLVPFGEYIPLKQYLPLEFLGVANINFTPDKTENIFYLEKFNLKIRPLICYEAIFADEINHEGADVLINVTNDAWYGNSSGPYQHLHMTRFRSIEAGLSLIRSANNGISAVIDPVGRIINHLPLNTTGDINQYIPLKMDNITLHNKHRCFCLTILLSIISLLTIFYPKKS